jgi:peptidoglycan biosynthesis protein MviN/MurJ (putative lipid II flippase)
LSKTSEAEDNKQDARPSSGGSIIMMNVRHGAAAAALSIHSVSYFFASTFAQNDSVSIPSHETENIVISIIIAVGCLITIFWLWMLIECLVKESDEGNTKVMWIGIILLSSWVGAMLYFIIRRPQRKAELGK